MKDRFEQRLDRKIEEVTTSGVVGNANAKPTPQSKKIEKDIEKEMSDLEKGRRPKDPMVKKNLEKSEKSKAMLAASVTQSVLNKDTKHLESNDFEYDREDLLEAVDRVFSQYYVYMNEDQE